MANPEDELDALHWEIIDVLREGRATPSYLSERTGESRQLISQRLRDLRLAGVVEKIHKGLYELDEDPRAPDPAGAAEPTEPVVEEAADEPEPEPVDDVDPIAEALKGWSYGRTDEEQAANDTVARKSLEWLRDEGGEEVKQEDVPLGELAEEDPEGRKPDTLWRSVVRGAWQHAAGRGYVEQPHSRAYRWGGQRSGE